ncbi:MAG: CBS domain-containing protein [Chitinophagaceae bacterium]|nr:CBS domain-containing protein [Chitinophagaceae bacterium]
MKKVKDILNRKGTSLIYVPKNTIVRDALKTMAEKNIGSILIMEDGQYLGLMTERDYARKVILQGRSSKELNVEEIMSTEHPHVSKEHSIEQCMQLMSENNVRYLPVFENNKLVGLISILDVIKETIVEQKETIQQLESYIHS